MSLLLAYTFNEQNTSPWDYSGNKQTGASLNVAFVAGQNYGYAAKIGQTSAHSYVSVSPGNFTGLGAFSIFTSFNLVSSPGAGSLGYIAFASGSFDLHINSSGNVVFEVFSSTTGHTVTSAGTIGTGWHTIGAIYDGANIYICIDGVQDANITAVTGTIDFGGGTVVYIGNDTNADTLNTLVANMDCIEFRSTAMSQVDIANLSNSPGGMQIMQTPNNFTFGDLIADGSLTNKAIVTWQSDADTFYVYPLTSIGSTYSRIGNIGTAARQYYMELITDFDGNGNGQIKISYPITCFADYASPANTLTFDYRGYSGSATPSGTAGGDLSGSYPNPTIKSSANLSGNPTTTTQSANDNSTKIATTAYVDTLIPQVAWTTYTPALTNLTSVTTNQAAYILIGKTLIVYSYVVATNNGTTHSWTLPNSYTALNLTIASCWTVCPTLNNSTGIAEINAGNNTVDMYGNAGSNNLTGAGTIKWNVSMIVQIS